MLQLIKKINLRLQFSYLIQSATAIATYMVKEWGMSEKVGFRTHETESNSLVVVNDLSPQTADVIDSEIKTILQVLDE